MEAQWTGEDLQAYANYDPENQEVQEIVVEGAEVPIDGAPIVIYQNDSSAVGAEEEVTEETLDWMVPSDVNEEVVSTQERVSDEIPEIPLHGETYAAHHPFPCEFCARRFKKKANLINHMVAHQTQRPHACKACTSRFMRKCDLVNHMKIHAYVPNRENFGKEFQNADLMQQLISSASGRRTRRRTSSGDSGSARRTSGIDRSRYAPQSPAASPDKSYVAEDVKLLLEMTTKLRGARSSPDTSSTTKSKATLEKPYECDKCGRTFARESALISHSQIHAEDRSYDCSKCGSRFFTATILREHMSKKHSIWLSSDGSDVEEGLEEREYTGDSRFGSSFCDICAISFQKPEQLKVHRRALHRLADENKGNRCKSCGAVFSNITSFLVHLDTNEECQKRVCLLCGENFLDQNYVESHIKVNHWDKPSNTCNKCGKRCPSSGALDKHMKRQHFGKGYHCTEASCRKKFGQWQQLKRHIAEHNSKIYTCEECGRLFADLKKYERHMAAHRAKKYSCEDCGRSFSDPRTYDMHICKPKPPVPASLIGRRFICSECGKSFTSRSSQQIHMRIHTGEKPYGCRYCWKAFADGGTLRKHERIHTGEKPYVCAVCPRAFNQRVVLREHIRSHHAIPDHSGQYKCAVCRQDVSSVEALAQHLIDHCDDNTRRERNKEPVTRQYIKRSNASNAIDEDEKLLLNSDTDSADSMPATSRKRRISYTNFTNTLDEAVENISSLVDAPPRRAKMINTALGTSVAKGGRRGRGRREVVSVPVVPKPRVRTMSGRLSGRSDPDEVRSRICARPEPGRGVVTEPESDGTSRARTNKLRMETLNALEKGLELAHYPEKDDCGKTEVDFKTETQECDVCHQVLAGKADLLFHMSVHI